jgi:predicted AAA+ superfamily ATPase
MIARTLAPHLVSKLNESKIVVLRGPKSSGRMTLLNSIMDLNQSDVLVLDARIKKMQQSFVTIAEFQQQTEGKAVVIIQEAQLLVQLQSIVDYCLETNAIQNLILTCSFEPQLHEALWDALKQQGLEMTLYPLSYSECAHHFGIAIEDKQLEQRLIYGYYPEIIENPQDVEEKLYSLIETRIFSQLGAHERINKKEKLIRLLRLLAFNIGKVISFNELGNQCDLDNETVERYVHLFEKADLLFVLSSYHNGHRYELKKSHIVYFVDNGIRNALIRAFQPFDYRNDIPELWRNWVLSERRKANAYAQRTPETFFWLTHTKQEIDYIEVEENQSFGIKLQWDKRKQVKVPSSFQSLYPAIKITGVNRSTFWTFLQKK